jgi:hypothetical protein
MEKWGWGRGSVREAARFGESTRIRWGRPCRTEPVYSYACRVVRGGVCSRSLLGGAVDGYLQMPAHMPRDEISVPVPRSPNSCM